MSRQFFEEAAEVWEIEDRTEKIGEFFVRTLIPSEARFIMDLGCGTGVLHKNLKKNIPGAQVYSVDFALGMLRNFRERYKSGKLVNARGAYLPFPEDFFDVIIIFNAFPHFEEKYKAVMDCYRILNSGGRLIISHSAPPEEINRIHSEIGGIVSNHQLPKKSRFIDMFNKAGFKSLKYVIRDHFYITGKKLFSERKLVHS